VTTNAKLPNGGFIFGGVSSERTNIDSCDGPDTTTIVTATSNLDNLRFCERDSPFRVLVKGSAGVTLPWDVQVSGSVQAVPGQRRRG